MADDVPLVLYHPAGLFLKADAKISILVKIPEIKVFGVTISNWEVMEKLKGLSKPEEFQNLRVVNYSRERIVFEGEFESLRAMRKVSLLLNGKLIKLSGFSDLLKVRVKQDGDSPAKQEWEAEQGDEELKRQASSWHECIRKEVQQACVNKECIVHSSIY